MPYIVDVTLDLCKMDFVGNKVLTLFVKGWIEHSPVLKNGCPLNGENSWLNWDINEHIPEFLPPIIPEGDFRLVMRIFNNKNHTFILIKHAILVQGTGVMKMSMLNMG